MTAMAAARECKNAIMFRKQFADVQDAYALSIVDTVRSCSKFADSLQASFC